MIKSPTTHGDMYYEIIGLKLYVHNKQGHCLVRCSPRGSEYNDFHSPIGGFASRAENIEDFFTKLEKTDINVELVRKYYKILKQIWERP